MQLITQYPLWFIIFCFALGALYAWLLYRKSNFKNEEGNGMLLKILWAMRFLTVSILAFLLLSPLLKYVSSTVEKPVIILALDNSQSVAANKDSAFYRNEFSKNWDKLAENLSKDYKVKKLYIGGNTNEEQALQFDRKKTNLSALFDFLNAGYAETNIGAVVIASDGIYNRGTNPIYKKLQFDAPVYTVGLGDTTIRKDVKLKAVNTNSIAYLDNEFPMAVETEAMACKGQTVTVTVSENGKTLFAKPLSIDNESFFSETSFSILADKPGTRHFIVSVSGVEGEATKLNNRKDVFVEVIDGREKIMVAYSGPHPDVAAIKDAIGQNKNYEVQSADIRTINIAALNDFSLVIFYQVPSRSASDLTLINQLKTKRIPVLNIIGTQSFVEQLGKISVAGNIMRHQNRWNDAQAKINPAFNAFTVSEELTSAFNSWPPLRVPYGTYSQNDVMEVLVYQKIGNIDTKQPLIGFMQEEGLKSGWIYGEGLWKWRLSEYEENENHDATNELLSKIVQYLTVKDDKRKFRVIPLKTTFDEDESVQFTAEIYNNNYELVNDRDVRMSIKNEEGKEFTYNFSRSGKSYSLNTGSLAAGSYSYTAKVAGGTNEEVQKGLFTVAPLQLELLDTRADHGILRQLAKQHNGSYFNVASMQSIEDAIKKNESIKPVSYPETQLKDLVSMKWVFVLLVLLLSAEWLIRKREGGY
ncbi:MAG: hypothetical protein H7321_08940 [Bacteroidia bacterium]|nr:hypothetical protein [Bacteroidia bacterium]